MFPYDLLTIGWPRLSMTRLLLLPPPPPAPPRMLRTLRFKAMRSPTRRSAAVPTPSAPPGTYILSHFHNCAQRSTMRLIRVGFCIVLCVFLIISFLPRICKPTHSTSYFLILTLLTPHYTTLHPTVSPARRPLKSPNWWTNTTLFTSATSSRRAKT